jgi:hypothetical protein
MNNDDKVFALLWGLGDLLDKHSAAISFNEDDGLTLIFADMANELDVITIPFNSEVASSGTILSLLQKARGEDEDYVVEEERKLN